jgi:hypothetical protein
VVAFVDLDKEISLQEELKKTNQNNDRMLSILGHDLRGPITNLTAVSSMVLDNVISQSEFTTLIQMMNVQSNKVLEMLEATLNWAKLNFNSIEQNDVEQHDLKGNVKILEEKIFEATEKFGEPVKLKLRDWSILTFDALGNIIEEKSMNENGEISAIKKLKYNNKNKIIEETFVCGDRSDLAKYIYDKNGNNIELTYYTNDKIAIKHVNKFDKKNNLIDHRLYEYDGALRDKTLSKFNEINLEFETEEYSFNGTSCVFTSKKTNEYDENGNLIEEKNYDEKGNLEFIYKYVYDEKHNEIEKTFSKDNTITKNTRTLDNFDNCIEDIEYSNDILKTKFTFNFRYDKKGNWIQRINRNNDIVSVITDRQIKYY